ncbi:uracil-DNA glycosylase [Taibaiella chishuiensis]|uniref:Uracil-DNA glycosylase n=1 Tax=Taibaiella chishuiensis TaxID=1434707 RepID=A0A2P8DCH0_9BACT|nr:uracil-DNA glycosylase [Taibaiella chishuiensis]PSK94918.1 uracil-DNA glycosylase [Taibaiella chishuiensis]
MNVQIEPSWQQVLAPEFDKPYFAGIVQYLKAEKAAGKEIYPAGPLIFNAFNLTPFDKVKAVLIGQDPYHGKGQAHGLSFSVPPGIKPPPSLMNMYKELKDDLGIDAPAHGCLEHWARQGLLMLNASLTVVAATPMSHSKIGWEQFTDAVIRTVSDKKEGVVFILWGRFAQQKEALIDKSKHFVLKAAHPSPFSAHSGFFGSKPYSRTNELLVQQGKTPIDWNLD